MEHLPPVSSPHDPIFVPYIGDCEYDGLDFAGYPSRKGFDIDRLLKGDFQGSSPRSVAAFLQTWLFFGLMHEILNVEIRTADFVRIDGSGERWLTTKKLPGYLQIFRQKIERDKGLPNSAEISRRRNDRIHKCFILSRSTWQGFVTWEKRYSVPNPISQETGFAIQVLAITLQVGATEICGARYRETPWEKGPSWMSTPNSFLRTRILAQGWCPSVVEQIQGSYNALGQYYASLLGPPKRNLDHRECGGDNRECIAETMGSDGYVIKHQAAGCQCKILKVDVSKLAGVIQNGDIPVLYLNQEKTSPTLDVVPWNSKSGPDYTAISHVWSDGWGNPTENSLPLCRVERLRRLISATHTMPDFDVGKMQRLPLQKYDGRDFFWMDTLCVPRTPKDVYKEAITKMRDVYANAERVLVLDAELMASTAEATYEEINMRIKCSTWIRRFWTIQEAVLAKKLIFQFAKRAHMVLTGSILWHARQKDLTVNYYNSIGWDCEVGFEEYSNRNGIDRIAFIWKKLLTHRSVTVAADEPLCGAILMDFDLNDMVKDEPKHEDDDILMKGEIKAEDKDILMNYRMRKFWSMHKNQVPVAVLFVQGPRLKSKGYSWAPSSFRMCSRAGRRLFDMAATGPYGSGGLSVKFAAYSAFRISAPQFPMPSVVPCTLDGQTYFIENQKDIINPSWDSLDLRNDKLAIILEIEPTQGHDRHWSFDGSRGALVSMLKHTNGTLFAKYIRLITVMREGRERRIPWETTQIEEAARTPCQAEFFVIEQEWHFD